MTSDTNDTPPALDPLETLVQQAAADPNARQAFYAALLDAVLTLPHGNDPAELTTDDGTLPEGTQVRLPHIDIDGQPHIPAFSSPAALHKAAPADTPMLQMPARAFFELTQGEHIVLNPGGHGKQLVPTEIEALLSGRLTDGLARRSVSEGQQLLLGQPKVYPSALTDALTKLFTDEPLIHAAYLAQLQIPREGDTPHTVVGLDTPGELPPPLLQRIGDAVRASTGPGDIIDLVRIAEDNPVSEYMRNDTDPFYQRALA